MKRAILTVATLGLALAMGAGCSSMTGEEKYTAAGAVTGGTLGAIIGNNVGDGENQEIGAAIGAVLGGLTGNQVGKQKDVTEARIRSLEEQAYTHVVSVHNSNNSVTQVALRKVGANQWQGPRGEVYNGLPHEDQLRPYYGLN